MVDSVPQPPAAAATPAAPLWLCRADELAERGLAKVFEVQQHRQTLGAFALRHEGRVVAYLNRCVHLPTEMDWQSGEFLDTEREFIICAIHGALYHPGNGRCAGGPCGRGQLTALQVEEKDGQVYWYPSRHIQPAPSAAESPP